MSLNKEVYKSLVQELLLKSDLTCEEGIQNYKEEIYKIISQIDDFEELKIFTECIVESLISVFIEIRRMMSQLMK